LAKSHYFHKANTTYIQCKQIDGTIYPRMHMEKKRKG